MDRFPWLLALVPGVVINAVDVACILAVKPWQAELRRRGLAPSKVTPPYYIVTNLIGGVILAYVYFHLARSSASGAATAVLASLPVWGISRIYGGRYVVMGQMPLSIFAIMSAGLGAGYVAGGQVFRMLLGH